jgi:toxin-antitoxin system PIN domain toxin
VKLPDVNLFVYAYDASAPQHEPAKEWLEDVLSGTETVALAWVALIGFIRLTTSRQWFGYTRSVEQALDIVDSWLAQPVATVIHPTSRHAAVLRDLLTPLGTGGNLTTDAHLAALAIEHGATLYSADNDFSRFAGLSWVDPLRD